MGSVIRGFAVYFVLLVLFRIAGKRSLTQVTTFDLVLTLIISEAIQQAMIDNDNSMTNGFLVIGTLIGADIFVSLLANRSSLVDNLVNGRPLVIVEDGRMLRDRMRRERIDEEDIMNAARGQEGLERLEQVKYAVVERNGDVTVVPKERE